MNTPTFDPAATLTAVSHYRPLPDLIPSHWQQGKATANGLRHYYYRTGGDKPPVVLLHGILEGALTWIRTAKALEADYDVIMIDTRGHGRSDRINDNGYTPTLLMEDTAGVMRALNVGLARVIGHSQGGGTAARLAAAYPELVHSFILEGAAETPSDNGNFDDLAASPGYQAWLDGYTTWLENLKSQSHAEQLAAGLTQLPPGAPILPEEEYVPWLDYCAHLDLALLRLSTTLWSELKENVREMEEAMSRVTCPALILKSAFSFGHSGPASVVEELSDRPNVRTVRFLNTGHLIHREQFDLFLSTIRPFLHDPGQRSPLPPRERG
jgi:pimeloyl-ACP methyl ester carboxylesterase